MKKRPVQLQRKINSSSNNPLNKLLLISLLFIILLIISLIISDKENLGKNYNPELEKKLNMTTIPSGIKDELTNTPSPVTYRVPILTYHYVEYILDKNDKIRISLNTTPFIFEQQIIALENEDYTFMTASELGKALNGEILMPKKPILLTFDDGHKDLYTNVFPLLKKYNVKATAYIIPGFLGGSDFMNDDQIREIIDSGLIEIGSHTLNHTYLKDQPLKKVQKQVGDSKVILQDKFQIPIFSFAYPYGAFDKQAIEVVKTAGFTTAMSTIPGVEINNSKRYFIERIRPENRIGESLIEFVENYKDPSKSEEN